MSSPTLTFAGGAHLQTSRPRTQSLTWNRAEPVLDPVFNLGLFTELLQNQDPIKDTKDEGGHLLLSTPKTREATCYFCTWGLRLKEGPLLLLYLEALRLKEGPLLLLY